MRLSFSLTGLMDRVSWPLRPADRPSPGGPDPTAVRPPPPATTTELGPRLGARSLAAAADPVAPAIELRAVVKDYDMAAGRFRALRDVNLEVRRGEFLAVVGRSASGKSTLMNMIAGIDRPTAGEVRVAGTRVDLLGEGELAAWRGRHLGIVFQFFQLLPTLTVLENVLIAMDFAGRIPGAERNDRAVMLLEQVGMADQAGKFPAAISGGQQQRVAIARALANDPPAIVADEPTGNLDAATADAVFELLRARAATGRTIVMVTHDNDLAAQTSRIVHLVDGVMGDGMLPDEAAG